MYFHTLFCGHKRLLSHLFKVSNRSAKPRHISVTQEREPALHQKVCGYEGFYVCVTLSFHTVPLHANKTHPNTEMEFANYVNKRVPPRMVYRNLNDDLGSVYVLWMLALFCLHE